MLEVKYVVTGTPRSATRFMGQLFTSVGIPIGHEMFYGMPGCGIYVDDAKGDSSWLAVPHLESIKNAGAIIIHIVRNPLKVVSSLHHSQINFDNPMDNMFTIYKVKHLPSIYRYQGLDRYLHFYIEWNKQIEKYADFRFRIEDLDKDPHILFDKIGVDIKGKKLHDDRRTNAYKDVEYLTLKDLDKCSLKNEFLSVAKKYGYNLGKTVKETSAQINKEQTYKNAKDFKEILDSHNIRFWIRGGTLLGFHREGDIIKNDEDDFDVMIWKKDTKKFLAVMPEFEKKGFNSYLYKQLASKDGTPNVMSLTRHGCMVGVVMTGTNEKEAFYRSGFKGHVSVFDKKLFQKFTNIKWRDLSFKAPKDIEGYLVQRYGKNWREPKRIGEGWTSHIDPNMNPCLRSNYPLGELL